MHGMIETNSLLSDPVNCNQLSGPILALTLFMFIGTTRNARQFYEYCMEVIYNSPKNQGGKNMVSMVDW